ncbi:glutamate ABC transporter substrate-binding protein [Nocardioides antri]|uniref:Glutamate ABC transporter substrate-binding protein n=1 Tax=Nocardioides antri TaxID=2607659 RepID=A0A5B1LZH1_9ACTN|nr:glutamate ABC transporter substrate-binding protein [Nocardioides antri]KAA1425598.1 glutamate ABC transporter substrate-binding protein [Nocardioides antri]
MRLSAKVAAATAAVALLVSACGYDETPLPEEKKAVAPESKPDCETPDESGTDPVASYNPGEGVPTGPKLDEIRGRERLIVGVSADTYLMGSENPELGNRIEGFDIEFAKAIGRAIFGDEFETGRNLELRVITAAQRIPLLEEGELDLVIRNFTINSERWGCIAFSAEYYHASQKVLVGTSLADGDEENGEYHDPSDLAGLRVCAPTGSTSLSRIQDLEPDAITEPASNHTGCLVKFQRGEVDAITGDDTVLAGLAAQDPYAVVPEQQPLSAEPYGIGVNQNDVDLVRFVNYVLEEMQTGAWDAAYRRWLQPLLDPERDDDVEQPTPVYGR